MSGVDRDGRASMCWRLGMFTPNEKSPHKHVRYLVYTMERTWAVSPLADHMNVIVDCKGVGLDTYHHATVSLAVDVLSHNYPDNLEVCKHLTRLPKVKSVSLNSLGKASQILSK